MEVIENPPMPYWGKIPGELTVGRLIQITGTVNHGTSSFSINFSRGRSMEECDIALHFNPRFDQRVVVRNTYLNQKWQDEEREPYTLPFQAGKEFNILFLVEIDGFRIAVDGRHYVEYKHRIPIGSFDKLHIEGNMKIKKIEYTSHNYKPSAPTIYQPQIYQPEPVFPKPQICTKGPLFPQPSFPPPLPYRPIRLPKVDDYIPMSKMPVPTTGPFLPPPRVPQPVFNPKMPFDYFFLEGLPIGIMIYFSGRCNANANNFRVDFRCPISNEKPPADIALHINPRFEERIVVRNSFISNHWGTEERSGDFPFARGAHFDLLINILDDKFMIAINGKHYCEYRHRIMPVCRVNHISVYGNVILSCCRFQ